MPSPVLYAHVPTRLGATVAGVVATVVTVEAVVLGAVVAVVEAVDGAVATGAMVVATQISVAPPEY